MSSTVLDNELITIDSVSDMIENSVCNSTTIQR